MHVLLDVEQVIAGLDRAAATMKKGERAILTISPEYGFGNMEIKKDLATVPPFSVLVYEVEMLDFVKVITVNVLQSPTTTTKTRQCPGHFLPLIAFAI